MAIHKNIGYNLRVFLGRLPNTTEDEPLTLDIELEIIGLVPFPLEKP